MISVPTACSRRATQANACGPPPDQPPLIHHFEQNLHVRHLRDQYGAEVCMDFTTTDPDRLADAITRTIGQQTIYREVETDGARRAAAMIAELVRLRETPSPRASAVRLFVNIC